MSSSFHKENTVFDFILRRQNKKEKPGLLGSIGQTPLVPLTDMPNVFAKLEYFNPGGSIKDRTAYFIVDDLIKKNLISPQSHLVDSSTGNFGISVALIASALNLKSTILIPNDSSSIKRKKIELLGGNVKLVDPEAPEDDPFSYNSIFTRLDNDPNVIRLRQMANPNNVLAHFFSTGPEIWQQTQGQVTHVVCGVGTGGTIMGISRFLKKKNPRIKMTVVDPEGSIYFDFIRTGKFIPDNQKILIEGVGDKMLSEFFDRTYVDDVISVKNEAVWDAFIKLNKSGLPVGLSSALAYAGLLEMQISQRDKVVLICPDGVDYYCLKDLRINDKSINFCGHGITEIP